MHAQRKEHDPTIDEVKVGSLDRSLASVAESASDWLGQTSGVRLHPRMFSVSEQRDVVSEQRRWEARAGCRRCTPSRARIF